MNPIVSRPDPLLYPPTRREFLKTLGTGLVVWVALGPKAWAEETAAPQPARKVPTGEDDFNSFLRIGEDGRVTCLTGKIEMGQGPITSLPQMLAEELDVPVDSVDIIMGDTELCPFDWGTWGSTSTRVYGVQLRAAAAEARGVLLQLAAETLQVPESRLAIRDGVVFDTADETRKVTFGQLTRGRRIERHLTAKPAPKKPDQFKVIGRSLRRRDARDKVTGQARYTADLRLPGMLYARVLRPPAHGAELKSVDASALNGVPGVQVVRQPDLVAVLHESPDRAEEALGKLKADFAPSPSPLTDETIYAYLEKHPMGLRTVVQEGDLARARDRATRRLTETYLGAYVAHAAMETHAALARVEGGQATVWASTQNPFGARGEIAEAIGLPPEKVRVITPPVGGGFGGKGFNLQAIEAARLSKLTGRPVQVMWSREEEFFNDTFRPASVIRVESGLDEHGRMAFWDYEVRFAGERGAEVLYDIADRRVRAVGSFSEKPGVHPFRVGAWRAPGVSNNTFARECHVDALAALAGVDPVEFRLRQMADRRVGRVLRAAAEAWGWEPKAGPSGRGLGVACSTDVGTVVAAIAQVELDPKDGRIKVRRVLCAQEMGLVINPEGAKMQMEGCLMMGLGYALTEGIRFRNGAVLDTNFDSYAIPRFSWLPKIETLLLDAKDDPPQGGGEPAVALTGALIGNAVFDLAGVRLRSLPMTPAVVKAALAAKA